MERQPATDGTTRLAQTDGHEGRRLRPLLALIAINALVLAALLGIANLASALVLSQVVLAKPPLAGGPQSPAFDGDEERMATFFREYAQLRMEYRDFVGWHRAPFQGETINIGASGERDTGLGPPPEDAPVARFFGGSTMWGTGAVDAETIPALFGAQGATFAIHNHGETAFVARQGLVELVDLLARGERADLVVFYDGVNDVGTLCRREIDMPGTIRQRQFDDVLDESSGLGEVGHALDTLFLTYTVRLVSQLRASGPEFDCASDPDKAARVAEHLVGTWRLAHDLVTARGGRFIGILQPVAYLGTARIDHIAADLDARGSLGAEFAAVYPRIRDLMRGIPYLHDFSDAFDGERIIFADWAHVNRVGNDIVARRIHALVEGRRSGGEGHRKGATRPRRWRLRHFGAVLLAALVLAALGAVAVYLWLPRDSSAHFMLTNLIGRPLGAAELGDEGPRSAILFGDPVGLAADAEGAIYVADRGRGAIGHVVWRISPDGRAVIIAGTGRKGRPDAPGPAATSQLASPESVALDSAGGVLVADSLNHVILRIGTDGVLMRIAGKGRAGDAGDGGMATEATLNHPYDVKVGTDGRIYIADYGNNRIRVVGIDGRIATLAGDGTAGYSGDGGPATAARLNGPYGVLPLDDGSLLVADSGNHVLRLITPDGTISTFAGTGVRGFTGDGGPAARALFDSPQALFATADGRIFVNDEHNHVVRVIDADGRISTLQRDDGGAARFVDPENVLVLADGSVLVADGDDARVFRLSSEGMLTAYAGIGRHAEIEPRAEETEP